MNQVFETETFTEVVASFDRSIHRWVESIKSKLIVDLRIGKPLRFDWFREKKLGPYRLYYLTNEHTQKALLAALGTKKDQQQIINTILLNKERYLRLLD
ncbi:MAG TPA: hypothetical protein VJH22_01365 [Candidatus Nanoarchaeia archaeon]|nr:hypothetical protein [Candidatus Nanoarchaeia archaeon]